MPPIEQKALDECKGEVLDVGCGAGSHSLYLQQHRNLKVKAIDTSEGAVEIARLRGLQNVQQEDFFKLKDERFDTILMLMNGSGIIGELENLQNFFEHSRSILTENGQILMDSSDLIYLFDEDISETDQYYGEFEFSISYKNLQSDNFKWLYIDPELLKKYAKENGFECDILQTGDNYDYLAALKLKH